MLETGFLQSQVFGHEVQQVKALCDPKQFVDEQLTHLSSRGTLAPGRPLFSGADARQGGNDDYQYLLRS